MLRRKSQAALEFLMTYGWAILVVLVAISALAYFGVLSPENFLPAKCTLPAGLACTDFVVSSTDINSVQVVLRNGIGYGMKNMVVRVGGCAIPLDTDPIGQDTLNNGDQRTWQITAVACPLTGGERLNIGFGITYDHADSGLSHILNGTITAKVG